MLHATVTISHPACGSVRLLLGFPIFQLLQIPRQPWKLGEPKQCCAADNTPCGHQRLPAAAAQFASSVMLVRPHTLALPHPPGAPSSARFAKPPQKVQQQQRARKKREGNLHIGTCLGRLEQVLQHCKLRCVVWSGRRTRRSLGLQRSASVLGRACLLLL